MGAITEPPEVLGELIGAALVGTFFGVLTAYGFIAPLASAVANVMNPEQEYLSVIKAGLMGHIEGYAPQVSVEFARRFSTASVGSIASSFGSSNPLQTSPSCVAPRSIKASRSFSKS